MPPWSSLLRRLALLLLLAPLSAWADTPTLEVHVSRDRIYLGESLLIEVKVGGSDDPGIPDLSAIRNGTPTLLGSQSSSQTTIIIVNGQMRREGFTGRTFTYRLTPVREGSMVVGPVKATVAGQTLTATGPAVTVTGVTRQDDVSVVVSASRDTILVDEPFDVTVSVRIRRLPERYADVDPIFPNDVPHIEADFLNGQEIDGLKGPDIKRVLNDLLTQRNQPGFSINNFTVQADLFDFGAMGLQGVPAHFKLPRQRVDEGGREYWEYNLSLRYSPLAEGSHTFGPVLFKGNVPRIARNGQTEGIPVFAVGSAAIVRVIPPPETNRPASYIGAIGSNLVVEAVLDAQTCSVGDPLKLALTVAGPVALRNLTPPRLSHQPALQESFEVYDDTVQTTRQDAKCQYTYTLRPRRSGSFELPPIEVAYYDVTTREYRTVKTPPIPLKVRDATEITAAQIIGGSTNQSLQLHREDETAMRPAGMRWSPAAESSPLLGPPGRWLAVALAGPLLFLVTLLGLAIRRHRPARREAQRRRRALHEARKAMQTAPAHELCGILRRYLAARFTARTESLTPSEARTLLTGKGIPVDVADRFAEQMQRYFNASYVTTSTPASLDTAALAALLDEIEHHLEVTRRKPPSPVGSALLLLLTLAPLASFASAPAERSFIWEEAMSEMGSAKTPTEFLVTASTYQKLIDLGVRNTDLFYNQGTALLLAGRPADAIEVLLRAERQGGSAPDIRRNLAIAEARKAGVKTPVASWLRLVLYWHYELSCSTRLLLAAGAFSGLWLAAAMLLAGLRRTGKALRIVSLVILVTFGSSVLATLHQESRVSRPTSLGTTDASSVM